MRVAFIYNESAEDPAHAAEEQDPTQSPIIEALCRLGHEVTPIACTLDLATVRQKIERAKPDAVFNRVESLGGTDAMIAVIPLLLESMRIPYTGCSAEALAATASKLAVKQRLAAAGLPTPGWITTNGSCHGDVEWPHRSSNIQHPASSIQFILKSVYEHASFELDDSAVIEAENVHDIVRAIREREVQTARPYFAERFIAGREFNLSVWGAGPEVLPPAEIDFSEFPPGKPHIVAYRAKCDVDSFEFHHTPRRFDFPSAEAPLLAHLGELAIDCWRRFNLRGFARVDFRVGADGRPSILEINPNPCLSPNAGFPAALKHSGLEYDEAIGRLLDFALPHSTRPQACGTTPSFVVLPSGGLNRLKPELRALTG
jgi:D-alanine-D-alanine ligase